MAHQHKNSYCLQQAPAVRCGVLARLRRLFGAWRVWTRDGYELRMLMAMRDDRLLRDAGINRYDAQWEMRRPFWDCGGRRDSD